MTKDMDHVAKVRIVVADQEGEHWALLSIKRVEGKRKHGKLEMLGGHLDQKESPLEALIRELGEEERTGYLSERVRALESQPLELDAGGALHHLFELVISEQEFKELQHNPKESLGFELIRMSELRDGQHWDRLTRRTQRILEALAPTELALYIFFWPEKAPELEWERIGDFAALITVSILALAYTVGVIIDRLADTLVTKLDELRLWLERTARKVWRRLRGKKIKNATTKGQVSPSFGEMRLYVRFEGDGISNFLDYARSRVRVARSTALNILLATVFGHIALTDSTERLSVLGIGIAAFFLSFYAWVRIKTVYEKRLRQAYDLVSKGREPRTHV